MASSTSPERNIFLRLLRALVFFSIANFPATFLPFNFPLDISQFLKMVVQLLLVFISILFFALLPQLLDVSVDFSHSLLLRLGLTELLYFLGWAFETFFWGFGSERPALRTVLFSFGVLLAQRFIPLTPLDTYFFFFVFLVGLLPPQEVFYLFPILDGSLGFECYLHFANKFTNSRFFG